jgi:hypothetical protein
VNRKEISFFIVFLFVTIGLYLLYSPLHLFPNISDFFTIFFTAALVIITAYYADSAYNQAKSAEKQAQLTNSTLSEMEEQRLFSIHPILILGRTIDYVDDGGIRIISRQSTYTNRTLIYNVGTGPAINLRFFLKIPNRFNPIQSREVKGLLALGTNEGYDCNTDSLFCFSHVNDIASSHDFVIEYEDVFGSKWRSGLELNYSQGQSYFTIIRMFCEQLP